jgi:hypothetical protein
MHTHDVAFVKRKQFFGGTTTTNDVVVHLYKELLKSYGEDTQTDTRDVIGRTDG